MRLLESLAKFCAILAGVLLTAITLMTCISLIGRNTIGLTLSGDFELTGVAAGAAIAPQPTRTCGRAPSTRKVVPLMKLAAGLSKNTIAAEVSASVPKRPKGTVSRISRSMGPASIGYWSMPLEAM